MAADDSGTHRCSVLGGPFALFMQGLLFSITCVVLIYKKYREDQQGVRRTWKTFILDGSKQFFGAGWIHVANMLCAILFAERLDGVDGCSWYAANIIVDVTIGVLIEYLLLEAVRWLLQHSSFDSLQRLLESGAYYDDSGEFRPLSYVGQLVVWLSIVTVMKLLMVAMLRVIPAFEYAIEGLLSAFEQPPQLKLFVVMIIIPLAMNSLQFWLTDNFIRKRTKEEDEDEDDDDSSEVDKKGEVVTEDEEASSLNADTGVE